MRTRDTTILFLTRPWAIIVVLSGSAVLCLLGCDEMESSQTEPVNKRDVTVTIIYDNNPGRKGLTPAWGFACLVRGPDKTVLFDTGGDGRTLLKNMRQLNINPREIDAVVLSHIHADVTGGVLRLLRIRPNIPVYIPTGFPPAFKKQLQSLSSGLIEAKKSETICRGVRTTGTLGEGSVEEQGLCVNTRKGWALITGCAHPGVANITATAKKMTNSPIYFVMGGFHMGWQSEAKINAEINRLQELGVREVAPSHCSGGSALKLFKERFEARCVLAGVGSEFQFHANHR